MRRTIDPLLQSIRRARAKTVSDKREQKAIPPPPESAPVPAPRVEMAPPPVEPETVPDKEQPKPPEPEKTMAIKTDPIIDTPPTPEPIMETDQTGFGLDWIIRRNTK